MSSLAPQYEVLFPSPTFFANGQLPPGRPLVKWVHITARKGGRYSHRASKAALNQATHKSDLHLKQTKQPAMAVAIHPGTMKADLSGDFWNGVPGSQSATPRELLGACLISSGSKRRTSKAKFGIGQGRRLLGEIYSHDGIKKIQGWTSQLAACALRQRHKVRSTTLVGNIPHCDFLPKQLNADSQSMVVTLNIGKIYYSRAHHNGWGRCMRCGSMSWACFRTADASPGFLFR